MRLETDSSRLWQLLTDQIRYLQIRADDLIRLAVNTFRYLFYLFQRSWHCHNIVYKVALQNTNAFFSKFSCHCHGLCEYDEWKYLFFKLKRDKLCTVIKQWTLFIKPVWLTSLLIYVLVFSFNFTKYQLNSFGYLNTL